MKQYGELEVIEKIRQRWPGLGDHAGYVLWNYTSFPFNDTEDALAHWLNQVEVYLKGTAQEWQALYG